MIDQAYTWLYVIIVFTGSLLIGESIRVLINKNKNK